MRSYYENQTSIDSFYEEFEALFQDDLKKCKYLEFHFYSNDKIKYKEAIKFIENMQNEKSIENSIYKFVDTNDYKDDIFYQIWIFYN